MGRGPGWGRGKSGGPKGWAERASPLPLTFQNAKNNLSINEILPFFPSSAESCNFDLYNYSRITSEGISLNNRA